MASPLALGDIFRWFLEISSAVSWRHPSLVLGDILRWFLATSSAGPWRQPLVDVPPSKRHPLGVSLTSTKRRQPPKRHPLGASSLKFLEISSAGSWRHPPLVLGDIFRWFLGASSAGSWRSSALRRFLLSRRSLRFLLSCFNTAAPLWGAAERSSIRIITHDLRLTIYDMLYAIFLPRLPSPPIAYGHIYDVGTLGRICFGAFSQMPDTL